MQDLLVDPALRIFLVLDSLPQGLVWLGFLAILGLAAARFFPFGRTKRATSKKTEPPTLRLWELAVLLRRARYSPWARRAIRARIARIAVAIRTERELIPPDAAWEDIAEGRWPKTGALANFLRGEGEDFVRDPGRAVDDLYHYAQGGEL